jgi:hypothetical protein
MKERKRLHKCECNNPKKKGYNYYVYRFIRQNGGFIEWNLYPLEKIRFDEKLELRKKEREYVDKLKPVLNSINPPKTATICEHGKTGNQCKECKGSCICEHNRKRSNCKECGGSSICEHNRRRSECKECGGGSICEHKRKRSTCKECGGSGICIHKRIRSSCKECGGGSICEHNRKRSRCKECGGNETILIHCKVCKQDYPKRDYRKHCKTKKHLKNLEE